MAREPRKGGKTQIYVPEDDLWSDETREAVHAELSERRYELWMRDRVARVKKAVEKRKRVLPVPPN